MNDGGYTLVETMAALLVLALAVGGLAGGVKVLSDRQLRVAATTTDLTARQRAQAALARLLAGEGPFGAHQPQRFAGRADAFAFACGEAEACGARLEAGATGVKMIVRRQGRDVAYRLPAAGAARFLYEGRLGASEAWPPERPERQELRAILVADGDAVLLRGRLWLEQPVTCDFDPVLEGCR